MYLRRDKFQFKCLSKVQTPWGHNYFVPGVSKNFFVWLIRLKMQCGNLIRLGWIVYMRSVMLLLQDSWQNGMERRKLLDLLSRWTIGASGAKKTGARTGRVYRTRPGAEALKVVKVTFRVVVCLWWVVFGRVGWIVWPAVVWMPEKYQRRH